MKQLTKDFAVSCGRALRNPWYVGADGSSYHHFVVSVLTTRLTCVWKLSEESTVTPKLRTDVIGMICWPQNVIGELLSWVRRHAVAQRMNCVFEGLRLRRLDCIQHTISSRQCSRRSSAGSVACGLLNTYICESSAYKWTSTPNRRAMISRKRDTHSLQKHIDGFKSKHIKSKRKDAQTHKTPSRVCITFSSVVRCSQVHQQECHHPLEWCSLSTANHEHVIITYYDPLYAGPHPTSNKETTPGWVLFFPCDVVR